MQDIRAFEAMAKLDLPEHERQWVAEQATMMLSGFSALEDIDTAQAEPLVSVLDVQNVLREDVAASCIPRERLLDAAPEQYNGYFQAPKTVE